MGIGSAAPGRPPSVGSGPRGDSRLPGRSARRCQLRLRGPRTPPRGSTCSTGGSGRSPAGVRSPVRATPSRRASRRRAIHETTSSSRGFGRRGRRPPRSHAPSPPKWPSDPGRRGPEGAREEGNGAVCGLPQSSASPQSLSIDPISSPRVEEKPTTVAPGTLLARFRLEEKLGAGGMGQVYRARDMALEGDVAIKLLPPEAVATPERRRRFETEAKVVATLSHPGIVPIYDIGESGGVPYILPEQGLA